VALGYYKDPDKTKEDFLSDGWFRTGDIGRWNEDGSLSIIDRRKNIFKLSQGEYIAPEKLEAVYARSPLVQQIWVCIFGLFFRKSRVL
jgi:long-chain acyl-CoA synthetase